MLTRQYLWMNETWCKVGLRPCYRKITRIFWIVLAALQNRLLSCCHGHADAATTTVSNKSLTELTDDCSELSLSPTLLSFLSVSHAHVHSCESGEWIHINLYRWCLMLSWLLLLTFALSEASCCCNQCKAYRSQAKLQ